MQAYAMLQLVRTWRCFDHLRFDNPFAFFTQCVKNSFNYVLREEKKNRMIRDSYTVEMGLTPSFGFSIEQDSRSFEASDSLQIVEEIDPVDNTPPAIDLGDDSPITC